MNGSCLRVEAMHKLEVFDWESVSLVSDDDNFVGIDSVSDCVESLLVQVVKVRSGDSCPKLSGLLASKNKCQKPCCIHTLALDFESRGNGVTVILEIVLCGIINDLF